MEHQKSTSLAHFSACSIIPSQSPKLELEVGIRNELVADPRKRDTVLSNPLSRLCLHPPFELVDVIPVAVVANDISVVHASVFNAITVIIVLSVV